MLKQGEILATYIIFVNFLTIVTSDMTTIEWSTLVPSTKWTLYSKQATRHLQGFCEKEDSVSKFDPSQLKQTG